MDRLKQALCLFVTDFLATQSQYQQVHLLNFILIQNLF
jgi:hypothetical protein